MLLQSSHALPPLNQTTETQPNVIASPRMCSFTQILRLYTFVLTGSAERVLTAPTKAALQEYAFY